MTGELRELEQRLAVAAEVGGVVEAERGRLEEILQKMLDQSEETREMLEEYRADQDDRDAKPPWWSRLLGSFARGRG